MRTITAFIVVLLSIGPETLSICNNQYGGAPCKFVPASPGKAPGCATPGLTYCEHPTYYPGQVIEQLIQNWQYDYNTLFSNESPEEFNSYFIPLSLRQGPKPVYGPPNLHHYSHPAPIHIPKSPQSTYTLPGNIYIPPPIPIRQNYSDGYHSGRPNYATEVEVPANHVYKSGLPNQNLNDFSYYGLPQVEQNTWWKRHARDLSRRRSRSLRRRRDIVRETLYTTKSNATHHDRYKRQTSSGMQLCQFRTQYIMPRAALNNKGNWMYIVNMPEVDNKYTQLVKSETCLSQECDGICGLPAGYTSRCEQKYAQKRLVALEGGGGQLYTDVFWFPSCCVCTLTKPN